jgi:hypothetical protein
MATKTLICPKDCEDKHSEHRITMAEIKSDLRYLKEGFEKIDAKLDAVIKQKADKEQMDKLEDKFKNFMIVLGTVALGIIGYLVIKWVENRT